MASGRGAGTGRDPISLWAAQHRAMGWSEKHTSLGTRYFIDPNDPLGRWIIDPRNPKRFMRVLWYLVDNPYEGGDAPGGGNDPGGGTQSTRETAAGQSGREITASAADGIIAGLYGENLIGADVTAHHVSGDVYWGQYGLGQGEIESVQAMYMPWGTNPKSIVNPTGVAAPFWEFAKYHVRRGTLTQTVSEYAGRAHNEWPGYVQVHPGHAYVAAQFIYNDFYMPDAPRPKFLIRGRKCYDPRLDANLVANGGVPTRNATTVVYTQNAALITADYAADNFFGYGLGDAGIDWISLKAEADVCDVVIGGEKRFTINACIRKEADQESILESLLVCWRGRAIPRRGKIVLTCERARASVFTFNSENSRPIRLHRHGSSKIPTAGLLHWTNPYRDWHTEPIPIETENAKNGVDEVRRAEWICEWITQPGQAARVLAYLFNRRRANLDLSIMPTTPEAEQIEAGDRITYIDDIAGFGGAGIELIADRLTDDQQGRRLFEVSVYSEALYSDATGVIETRVDTTLDDAFGALAPPTGIVLTETVSNPSPGVFIPQISIAFVRNASPYYGGTVFEYRANGGVWNRLPSYDVGPITILAPDGDGVLIEVRGMTMNKLSRILGAASLIVSLTTAARPNPEPVIYATLEQVPGSDQIVVNYQKPQIRTHELYDGSHWTAGGGVTGFVPGNVSNGNKAVNCAVIPVNGYITLDAGAGQTRELRGIRMYGSNLSALSAYYSDDGSAFTLADDAQRSFIDSHFWSMSGTSPTAEAVDWTSEGSHRWWRFKNVGIYTITATELEVYEYVGSYEDGVSVNIYDATEGLLTPVKPLFRPVPYEQDASIRATGVSPGNGIDVTALIQKDTTHVPGAGNISYHLSVRLVVVSRFGEMSDPIDLTLLLEVPINNNSYASQLLTAANSIEVANKNFGATNSGVTAAASDTSTQLATNAFVHDVLSAAIGSTVQPYDADLAALAAAGSTGANAFVRANAPQIQSPNITDSILDLNGARLQIFAVELANNGGALQHRIVHAGFTTAQASAYAGKIAGASTVYTNTPLTSPTVGMVAGGGIEASAPWVFHLDTISQNSTKFGAMAVLEYNDTGNAIQVQPRLRNVDINGVTRQRLGFETRTAVTGALFNMNTTNIPAGKFIRIRIWALVE